MSKTYTREQKIAHAKNEQHRYTRYLRERNARKMVKKMTKLDNDQYSDTIPNDERLRRAL